MQIRLLVCSLLLASFTFGQTLDVDKIYNFSPNKLTKSEQEKKLPALDGFWNQVKADTTKYLPLLRSELNGPNHNPFFYYDASTLLLYLSKSENDKIIAANAIAKCNLTDINHKEYVTTLNGLSNDGINVISAAVKILNDTSYSFYLPQHAMYFTQSYCLIYMLLPQKQELYVDTLISLFKSVNPNSQKAILNTLWFAYTCKGDSLIKAALVDKSLSKDVNDYADEIMKSSDLSNEVKEYIKTIDKNQLDMIRKESLQRFSDEAIDELTITTLALRKDVNCR